MYTNHNAKKKQNLKKYVKNQEKKRVPIYYIEYHVNKLVFVVKWLDIVMKNQLLNNP